MFTLLGGPGYATALASTVATGVQAGRLTATPSALSLPTGGLGTITVAWWTADGSDAQVWVSVNGAPQKLMAEGPSGTASPGWVAPGSTVFSLSPGSAQATLLDT